MVKRLEDTTVRDFGGGWNVADSDLNLSSRYQPISDNIARGVDGSFYPRMGMGLYTDFATGTVTELGEVAVTAATVNTNPKITVTHAAHGFASGDHVTISGAVDLNGVEAEHINGTHGIIVVDANTYFFNVRVAATATGSVASTWTITHDDHLIAGNIIHDYYFNRRLIVFTDIGEVATVDGDFLMTRIWGAEEAETLTTGLAPTRRCNHWSCGTFKSTVIACNGYDKDKPIQIKDDFTVEFLVDKASSSNAAVPKADYVVCLHGYVCFIRTEYGDPFIEMSAKGTDGTFTRDPNPSDSVEIDLSMITETVEPVLLGAGQLRDKLYAAFYDRGMIGTLGAYNTAGTQHNPDFSDTIAEHGAVSHRTIVSLGNDIFMCDYAGVPSVSVSQQSGVYVPVRLSELIAPEIQKHLANLSEDTLRSKAFAVFNRSDRTYMLFLPIYDETEYDLPSDPFIFNNDLVALGYALVYAPSHKLFARSCVTITGAVDIGDLTADKINGVREVVSIKDKDTFIIKLGGAPTSQDVTSGGGANVKYTPVNDETIVYAFEYNKEFKIRRWTRYRDWNFDCACSSQRGKIFMCKGLKVYRMGDNEIPLYADFVGDYDHRNWANNTLYTVGIRVRDDDDKVYTCTEEHISPATGTFSDHRSARLNLWEEYVGEPIEWEAETPWSDMKHRGRNKINKYINIDSEGNDQFTVSAFTNQIRNSGTTNELVPSRSLQMSAGDTGGWGEQYPTSWGSGRRTREEKVWPFALRGKLIRWRFSGRTTRRVRITSLTMYYKLGNIR